MDGRATEVTHTEPNRLQALPQELQLLICDNLSTPSILTMQSTSLFYKKLLNDHVFWKIKHNQTFPPSPFHGDDDDNKNQYRAAWMYHHAKSYYGQDKQQIILLKLYRFLYPINKTWTHYYRGLLCFQGEGTKRDIETGFASLLAALDNNDSRAAIKIGHILIENKLNDSALYNKLIQSAGDARLKLIFALILGIHNQNIKNMTKLLGRLYAHGVGVDSNFLQAEKYFLESSNNTTDNISELAKLKFDSLSNSLNYEEKTEKSIIYLKTLTGKAPAESLQEVINYFSAYLELCRGNNQEALRLLHTINNLPVAKKFLAQMLLDGRQPNRAIQQLVDIVDTEEDVTRELFDMHREVYPSLHECITRTKALTDCRMIEIADKVSAEYRRDNDMDILAGDPNTVWWIQLAAQAGCAQSLAALNSVEAQQYPYICYALGVIHEFGILHSDELQPNHDRAEYYFNLARHFADLDIYLLTGISEDFACQEVMDLLLSKLNVSPRNLNK